MKDNGLIEFRWHGQGGPGGQNGLPAPGGRRLQFREVRPGLPRIRPRADGGPITAYNRISDARCSIHCNIDEPDYVVVVDERDPGPELPNTPCSARQ